MTDTQRAVDAYLSSRTTTSAQAAAARLPHAQAGAVGDWSIEAYGVERWNAAVTPTHPHGRIDMAPLGWLAIDLDDIQGWKPFIAVAGMDAGRTGVQANIAFRWDGTRVMVTNAATFDPAMTLWEVLGPVSDGTLAQNGQRSRIEFTVNDGQPWSIDLAFVGWTQLF